MTSRIFAALFASIVFGSAGVFARDASAQAEIDYLIDRVAKAKAHFIRNGSDYEGEAAADHLRMKLGKAGDRVKTAEDFIEGVASRSSLSGKPYMMKFPDGRTQPSGAWLKEQLAHYRKAHPSAQN